MQTISIAFFVIAGIASAVLLPNSLSLLPVLTVSAARAATLFLALLFWTASGKFDNWGRPRFLLAVGVLIGSLLLSVGCLMIQMTRDDNVPPPMPMVYRVVAALLPICFVAGVFLGSKSTVLIVSLLAPIAGLTAASTHETLRKIYIARLPETKARLEHEQRVAGKIAELDAIPSTAGPEPLLEHIAPSEYHEVDQAAQARIEAMPDWIARLSALLDGEKRRLALYSLTRRMDQLPDAAVERCWNAAASITKADAQGLKNGVSPKEVDQLILLYSVESLAIKSEEGRERHWKEIAELRDCLLAANNPSSANRLSTWVRKDELRRVPENAGIAPLLAFTGPFEGFDIRKEALQRIAKVPESTAKLVKMLDGPHRLDVLVVLGERVDDLSPEQLELCWRADTHAAKEMAEGLEHGKRPTQHDVRKLSSTAGIFWRKLGADPAKRLDDLAVMRDTVRAAGDQYEKQNLSWADPILANASAAKTAGNAK